MYSGIINNVPTIFMNALNIFMSEPNNGLSAITESMANIPEII